MDSNYYQVQMYLKNKFDKSYNPNLYKLSYFERQLISYDEKTAIEHIKQSHYFDNIEKSTFISDIDIDSLFYQIKEYIAKNMNKALLNRPNIDNYLFYYPHCGRSSENVICNYIEVCVFTNTNNILTMYPSNHFKNRDICNLKELQEEKTIVKVKSGLERFQSRYNN